MTSSPIRISTAIPAPPGRTATPISSRTYTQAEQLLGVAGQAGADPTEPPRSSPYPQAPAPLAPISQRMADVARGLGLHPFSLPLAINYAPRRRPHLRACGTCDGFACAVSAKNDIATTLIPTLERGGLTLAPNTVAVRLEVDGAALPTCRASIARRTSRAVYRRRTVVLAAGALATPHLLLASGLDARNPAGDAIGRYLMRHCNAVVMGVFPRGPAPDGEFHKQIGIQDYYYGHPSVDEPHGKLGCIQQFGDTADRLHGSPRDDWIDKRTGLQRRSPLGRAVVRAVRRAAHDRVHRDRRRPAAGAAIGWRWTRRADRVRHAAGRRSRIEYDARDLAARDALVARRRADSARRPAPLTIFRDRRSRRSRTPSARSASAAIRRAAPLDEWGAFRGLDNLYVTDGSVLPRSGGVNPSLTIAANALRTGERIARQQL